MMEWVCTLDEVACETKISTFLARSVVIDSSKYTNIEQRTIITPKSLTGHTPLGAPSAKAPREQNVTK